MPFKLCFFLSLVLGSANAPCKNLTWSQPGRGRLVPACKFVCFVRLGVQYPIITGLNGWWAPGQPLRTQETVPDRRTGAYLVRADCEWLMYFTMFLAWHVSSSCTYMLYKKQTRCLRITQHMKIFYTGYEQNLHEKILDNTLVFGCNVMRLIGLLTHSQSREPWLVLMCSHELFDKNVVLTGCVW